MTCKRLAVFVVAIHVISLGCSGSGGASGGFDFIHVDEPDWYVWYHGALVATVLYLPIAPLLAVRAADARVVAALPFLGSTALCAFTLLKGVERVSDTGVEFGRGLVAAVLAESIFPWSIGCAASAVTSVAIGIVAAKRGTVPRTSPSGSIALAVSPAVTICTAGLMLHVWRTAGRDAVLSASAASILFVTSLADLSAAAVSAFWLRRRMSRAASPRWLWLFAMAAAVAWILLFLTSRMLSAIAEAGG